MYRRKQAVDGSIKALYLYEIAGSISVRDAGLINKEFPLMKRTLERWAKDGGTSPPLSKFFTPVTAYHLLREKPMRMSDEAFFKALAKLVVAHYKLIKEAIENPTL